MKQAAKEWAAENAGYDSTSTVAAARMERSRVGHYAWIKVTTVVSHNVICTPKPTLSIMEHVNQTVYDQAGRAASAPLRPLQQPSRQSAHVAVQCGQVSWSVPLACAARIGLTTSSDDDRARCDTPAVPSAAGSRAPVAECPCFASIEPLHVWPPENRPSSIRTSNG